MINHFTVGIIEAGISIIDELEFEQNRTISDIIRVKEETGTLTEDFKNAQNLILDFGETLFKNQGNFENIRKAILYNMISNINPPWKSILRQGSSIFHSYISEILDGGNIIQSFSYAGLDDDSKESISWWKQISNIANIEDSNMKEKLGLEGEILTIKYEKKILKGLNIDKTPEHISTLDSSAGYDVLSWRKDEYGNTYELKIESKMSSFMPTRFYLSRNEYETALNNMDSYEVYLWHKDDTTDSEPQKFIPNWLIDNTPNDSGLGQWREALIIPTGEKNI